jgi:hypothetical protein
MRLIITLAAAAAALLSAGTAQAASFTCPATLDSDATSGGQPQTFKFRYVSFFDGDPEELADLAPEELRPRQARSAGNSCARRAGPSS